jgi:sortase A
VLALLWSLVTWRVGDPLTALYQKYEQRSLRSDYAESTQQFAAERNRILHVSSSAPAPQRTLQQATHDLERLATAYRRHLNAGDAVGVLTVPALGLRTVVVDGTSSSSLKRGPGLDRRSYLPGQGELVYIAGHRTTYGAPFAHIDALKPGDPVYVELPYAKLTYRITGHRIVDANALGVLRTQGHEHLALQACHPRFFATQRYIADAELVRFALVENDSLHPYTVAGSGS